MKTNTLMNVLGLLLLLISGGVLAASCSKGAIYGELEGNWEIMQVTDQEGKDMEITPQRYYSLMRNVVQLRSEKRVIFTGNMVYNEPYISMSFPDSEIRNRLEVLKEWWLFSDNVTLKVEKLDKKTLILSTDNYRIQCRRY